MEEEIYFQRQSRFSLMCGMFSVNHLLGGKIFDQKKMDNICYTLNDDFINPHKHVFGGDYDANVLFMALGEYGYEAQWFNNEKGPLDIARDEQNPLFTGYLVNIYTEGAPKLLHKIFRISTRHWLSIRKIKDNYYILDSKNQSGIKQKGVQIEEYLNNERAKQVDVEERIHIIKVFKVKG